mgnify:FL=1
MKIAKYIDITYLLTLLITALIVFIFGLTIDFNAIVKPTYYVRCIMDGSIIALPVLLAWASLKKPLAIAINVALVPFLLVNYSYATFFGNFVPLSSYLMVENVNSLLFDNFIYSVKYCWLIVLPLPLLFFVKKGKACRIWPILLVAVVALNAAFIALEIYIANRALKSKGLPTYNRYTDPEAYDFDIGIIVANGLVPYMWSYYNLQQTFVERNIVLYDHKSIDTSLLPNGHDDNNYAFAKGKNLIIIFVESLNSTLIDYKIGGNEVCPNLNQMFNDTASISAIVKPQVKFGSSSDAHFIVNTGLLPLHNKITVQVIGSVPSIAKALNNYSSFISTTDVKYYWNQYATSSFYGYQENYYAERLNDEYGITHLLDKEILKFTANKAISQPKPFVAQVVTIAMHFPFNRVKEKQEWIMAADSLDNDTKRYLNSAHYFDNSLGEFIGNLKKNNLYDNCVIAIMGDHITNKVGTTVASSNTAMVILNSQCPAGTLPHPVFMRQVDIYPTLLDLMGANHYQWKGLGHSIFRPTTPNDERVLDNLSEQLILSEYFQHHTF